jgi:hypothetical protein
MFDWKNIWVPGLVGLGMIVFPQASRVWPFSTFTIIEQRARFSGVLVVGFFALGFALIFTSATSKLSSLREAYAKADYETITGQYERSPERAETMAGRIDQARSLSVGGLQFKPPGVSGSSYYARAIKDQITDGEVLSVLVVGETVIEVRRSN